MKFKFTGNISYCIKSDLYTTKTFPPAAPTDLLKNGLRYFVTETFMFSGCYPC